MKWDLLGAMFRTGHVYGWRRSFGLKKCRHNKLFSNPDQERTQTFLEDTFEEMTSLYKSSKAPL